MEESSSPGVPLPRNPEEHPHFRRSKIAPVAGRERIRTPSAADLERAASSAVAVTEIRGCRGSWRGDPRSAAATVGCGVGAVRQQRRDTREQGPGGVPLCQLSSRNKVDAPSTTRTLVRPRYGTRRSCARTRARRETVPTRSRRRRTHRVHGERARRGTDILPRNLTRTTLVQGTDILPRNLITTTWRACVRGRPVIILDYRNGLSWR
jgi:hypothetical protein